MTQEANKERGRLKLRSKLTAALALGALGATGWIFVQQGAQPQVEQEMNWPQIYQAAISPNGELLVIVSGPLRAAPKLVSTISVLDGRSSNQNRQGASNVSFCQAGSCILFAEGKGDNWRIVAADISSSGLHSEKTIAEFGSAPGLPIDLGDTTTLLLTGEARLGSERAAGRWRRIGANGSTIWASEQLAGVVWNAQSLDDGSWFYLQHESASGGTRLVVEPRSAKSKLAWLPAILIGGTAQLSCSRSGASCIRIASVPTQNQTGWIEILQPGNACRISLPDEAPVSVSRASDVPRFALAVTGGGKYRVRVYEILDERTCATKEVLSI